MKTYTYIDYTKNNEIIFTCQADSILEADNKLLDEKGINASKNSQIGCRPGDVLEIKGPSMR